MKLESLLAPYLYQYKVLNLPGIGSFTAEKTVGTPEDNEKHPALVQGISFTNKNVTEPDAAFIDFIKQHTGKMRPLAISDLESYLMLSRQFLNIGKPFHIGGIGTLIKSNDGSLHFTPGEYSSVNLSAASEEKAAKEPASRHQPESAGQRSVPASERVMSNKTLLIFAALVTVVLIGWGGYYLFKKNTPPEEILTDTAGAETGVASAGVDSVFQQTLTADTVNQAKKDTLSVSVAPPPPGVYKFVLEKTSSRNRAMKRFGDLMSYRSPVKMETTDSVRFTIYALIKGTPADTARLKDSLNAWYYGTREMKVSIAQ